MTGNFASSYSVKPFIDMTICSLGVLYRTVNF